MNLYDGVATSIDLPDSLEWIDEYKWSKVTQDIAPTIGGGLIIQEAIVSKGRPITLVGGENVWVLKSVLDALMLLIDTPDEIFTLTLPDARTFTVIFDRRGIPLEAEPVWRKNVQEPTTYYTIKLKLMEV